MKKILALLVLLAPGAAAQESNTATVTGVVAYNGESPRAQMERDLMKEPTCAKCYEKAPPKEELLVSKGGGIKWAFVYVKSGLKGRRFDPPKSAALLDQVGCLYTPRVLGVVLGQKIDIRNSDDFLHNVHGLPLSNKEFNVPQPAKGMVYTHEFKAAEVMAFIKCEVHPWMRAWVGVVEHPFFAVSDADGKFTIKGLPPGKYTLEVWQEKCGKATQDIEVKANETKSVEFKMEARKP